MSACEGWRTGPSVRRPDGSDEVAWERVLALLEEIRRRGLEPHGISYRAAIEALAKAGRVQEACVLFRQARDLDSLPPPGGGPGSRSR